MTIEQLKERVEAQCMRYGFEVKILSLLPIGCNSVYCSCKILNDVYHLSAPDTELLLERVDWECKVIKAYQSRATNGIDL